MHFKLNVLVNKEQFVKYVSVHISRIHAYH